MNLQSIWQTLQDPAWEGLAALFAAVALLAAALNFLVIKPTRYWLARRRDEKEVVRNLLRFLENRRVLYSPFAEEHVSDVINSVYQIRNRLGEDIERLDEGSNASRPVREMQAACRNFLSLIGSLPAVSEGEITYPRWEHQEAFVRSLNELRTIFGAYANELYEGYGIKQGERAPDWGPMGEPYRMEQIERTIRPEIKPGTPIRSKEQARRIPAPESVDDSDEKEQRVDEPPSNERAPEG